MPVVFDCKKDFKAIWLSTRYAIACNRNSLKAGGINRRWINTWLL